MTTDHLVPLTVRFPKHLHDRLDEFTRQPGVSRAAIVCEALAEWFDRKGDDSVELRFGRRFDRISVQLNRIERNSHILIESLGLFIRYMLTVNPPVPEGDPAARALGRDRFAAFVERVGQQLADGRFSLVPDEPR